MSQLLKIIHTHLKQQGHNACLAHVNNKPSIIINTIQNDYATQITETEDTINLRIYTHVTRISKSDPQLLTKITKWYQTAPTYPPSLITTNHQNTP